MNKNISHFCCVGDFHKCSGHPRHNDENCGKLNDDYSLLAFRLNLIEEEFKECLDAIREKNIIELADGLCDLIYVIYGAGHVFGINLDELITNLNLNIDKPSSFNNNINIKLFDEYESVVNLEMQDLYSDITIFKKYINENNKNLRDFGLYLLKILESVYNFGHILHFDMDLMFRDVHKSNMTKFCSTLEDAIESVKSYKNDARYNDPDYKFVDPYYVIYDKKTSKTLKNHKWKLPNLDQFINNYI